MFKGYAYFYDILMWMPMIANILFMAARMLIITVTKSINVSVLVHAPQIHQQSISLTCGWHVR